MSQIMNLAPEIEKCSECIEGLYNIPSGNCYTWENLLNLIETDKKLSFAVI
jgi:hypothetical protein